MTATTPSWDQLIPTTVLAHVRPGDDARPSIRRIRLAGAVRGKLAFSQVREDPLVDAAIVEPASRRHVVVVTSGGCNALHLLASGAGRVSAVDLNTTQNDLAELVTAAIATFEDLELLEFLGGVAADRETRLRRYEELRPLLDPDTRAWWDTVPDLVGRGVLRAGVTERFLYLFVPLLRHGVLPRGTIDELFGADTLEDQRQIYRTRWNTWRWRLLFTLGVNRATCRPIYKTFFDNVDSTRFSHYFRGLFEHALSDVPIGGNWYAYELLRGGYDHGCLPPHLRPKACDAIRARREDLTLVDGSVTSYLATQPEGSVDAFCLSNIGEWLDEAGRHDLLRSVIRAAAPGAVVVMRNLIARTDTIPLDLRDELVEDPELVAATDAFDHSIVHYQVLAYHVRPR